MASTIVVRESANTYRAMAKDEYKQADDSFDRCDTDGFVSQWANDLTGRMYAKAAEVAEDGGWYFSKLERLDGQPCFAKLIRGQYGMCWAILGGEGGEFTGEFVTAFPARESTMARKGYREVEEFVPANKCAVIIKAPKGARGLSGAGSCYVAVVDGRSWIDN